jgi:beta-glucosidase
MMMGRPAEVIYQVGIYVGYRYFDSFKISPAYEFGYGLSYTKFKLSDATISSPTFKNSITIKVTVKNEGKKAGKEVVQLYISAPHQNIDKPEQELKAFVKTGVIAPGMSQVVTLTLKTADLASYYTDKSEWIADAGEYKVKVGTSSRQIAKTLSFTLAGDVVTEKTHNSLAPQVAIDEMINK